MWFVSAILALPAVADAMRHHVDFADLSHVGVAGEINGKKNGMEFSLCRGY